jgi:hypothetical protein
MHSCCSCGSNDSGDDFCQVKLAGVSQEMESYVSLAALSKVLFLHLVCGLILLNGGSL